MKVILTSDVQDVGKAGDIKNVSDGFYRNFLFPKGLAVVADERRKQELEHQKRVIAKKAERLHKLTMSLREKIEAVSITIARQAAEEDKIFGSVTARDIGQALAEQGVEIDHRNILLDKPIKQLGSFNIDVKLHGDVRATLRLWVVKE